MTEPSSSSQNVFTLMLGIWFVMWGYRRKFDLDIKLDRTDQTLRWATIALAFGVMSLPGPQYRWLRVAALPVATAFFAWPNFGHHLTVLLRRLGVMSPKPIRTVIEIGTTEQVYLVVHFSTPDVPPAHGYFEPGATLRFTTSVDEINDMEYRIGRNEWRLDKGEVAAMAQTIGPGLVRITLKESPAPVG